MLRLAKTALADILSLVFPQCCYCCGTTLICGEEIICCECRYKLPYTDFHLHADNPLAKQFWGRVKFESASSCFYFTQNSGIRKLIHKLKYADRPELGVWLGKQCANRMPASPKPDLIIPVPLHPERLKKRGYNQSEQIARGISEVSGIPLVTGALTRLKSTPSQTGMSSRFKRHSNVYNSFAVIKPEELRHKCILLVDDVITTGATIEACAKVLSRVEGTKLAILSVCHTF